MMKNILITGGAGFIGSKLAIRLLELGYQVRILDNLSPQIHGADPEQTSQLYNSIKDRTDFMRGTVLSRNDLEKAIVNQDVIVHLAAETGTGQSMYEVERYTEVNIQGTSLLLDILVNLQHRIEKVVVASSRAIYGEGRYLSNELGTVFPGHRHDEDMKRGDFEVKYPGSGPLTLMPTDETSRIHPSSIYGITKQVQEQLVLNVSSFSDFVGVSFRYQNVYGPGQSLSNPYTGILSIFSNRIRQDQPVNIFEDGEESRDFVFIDDVVDATIAGIEREEANNQVFNVGTGVQTTVMDVARALVSYYGNEVPLEISGMFRSGDIRHNYADTRKIKSLLGFTTRISFEEGIRRFAEWVQTQPAQEAGYEKSIREMKDKGLIK